MSDRSRQHGPATYLEICPVDSVGCRLCCRGAEKLSVAERDRGEPIELSPGSDNGQVPSHSIERACRRGVRSDIRYAVRRAKGMHDECLLAGSTDARDHVHGRVGRAIGDFQRAVGCNSQDGRVYLKNLEESVARITAVMRHRSRCRIECASCAWADNVGQKQEQHRDCQGCQPLTRRASEANDWDLVPVSSTGYCS